MPTSDELAALDAERRRRAGEKWRAVQGRWTIVADGEDRRAADCAAFYGDVRAGLGAAERQRRSER